MWRAYSGVILIIGGIAAFIEADRHIPVPSRHPGIGVIIPASGLSDTAYDLVRLGGWALVILGAVSVIASLIRYAVQYAVAKQSATTEISSNGGSRRERPMRTAKTPTPSDIEGSPPWDEGAHGEAVEPSPRR
jgi:hypothetical protein